GPKTSIICSPMTSLKTSIKTITYLSDIGCLEIQGASLVRPVCMAWNTDVSADGKPHSLWKQGRALASQPESVTKTNIAENRIHRSGVNARRQKPLSTQSPSDLNKKHTHNRLT
ncbi:hypothetical protein, partial [Escherichia coli]